MKYTKYFIAPLLTAFTIEFIKFLKSDEGEAIFARNGWSR